jgi:hypothetical protein
VCHSESRNHSFGMSASWIAFCPARPAQQRVVVAQPLARDEPVRIEPRHKHDVPVHHVAEQTQLHCVRRRLQILHVPPNEKRLPVLRKQVIQKQQVPRTPRQHLPADLHVHEFRRRKRDIHLAQIQKPPPALQVHAVAVQHGVIQQIGRNIEREGIGQCLADLKLQPRLTNRSILLMPIPLRPQTPAHLPVPRQVQRLPQLLKLPPTPRIRVLLRRLRSSPLLRRRLQPRRQSRRIRGPLLTLPHQPRRQGRRIIGRSLPPGS